MWESRSDDGGRTWTPPRRLTLVNNESTVDAVEIWPGVLLVCYNNQTDPDWHRRYPLNLAFSKDYGETWEDFACVYPGPGIIDNVNIHLGADSRLHVVHRVNFPTVRYACYAITE